MARSVADIAVLLNVIAGTDPLDNFTFAQPPTLPDYTKSLNASALSGARIGVPRKGFFVNETINGMNASVNGLYDSVLEAFEQAIETIKGLGATVVDNADLPSIEEILVSADELFAQEVDFKVRYFKILETNDCHIEICVRLSR